MPVEDATRPTTVPLQATITEMPPPPMPAGAPRNARPKPQRPTAVRPPAGVRAARREDSRAEGARAPIEPTAEAIATGPEPPTEVAAAPPPDACAEPPKTLPRRVDLVYKVFLGTQGFLIGEAIYRFEHAARTTTSRRSARRRASPRSSCAARASSKAAGSSPRPACSRYEFAVERGSSERRETAVFDWETGIVTLHEQKTEALELSTYDPLTLMWQAYFSPPVDDVQDISIATTRRVGRYTLTREADEKIAWAQGEIDTERWHRRSDDGKTDANVWLAPSLHYVPVKMRVTANYEPLRGTLEALLDSIRVDEALAQQ